MIGRTIILDIETAAGAIDLIPSDMEAPGNLKDPNKIKESLKKKRQELTDRAALDWVTGKVVAVGIMDIDGSPTAICCDTEAHTLENMWEHLANEITVQTTSDKTTQFFVTKVVTFNGTGFDIPFLRWRMAVNGIDNCRPDIFSSYSRYARGVHIDLYNYLTEFGTSTRWKGGQTLDFFCRVFDIDIPDNSGISGRDVPALWAKGKTAPIIKHMKADLERTAALYRRIEQWLPEDLRY